MNTKDASDILLKVLTSRMTPNKMPTSFPPIRYVYDLISTVQNIFLQEENILKLDGDFVVVGDIHGNVDDLIRIFEMRKYPPETKYVFLGDYVDRGECSVEVLLILYSLKVLYPNHIYLIRGNHEAVSVSSYYGFKRECSRKYSQKIYYRFNESFQNLSFAAILNGKYFCVHGGISPQTMNLEVMDKIQKPIDNDMSPEITGFVWSDPNKNAKGFQRSDRGTGFLFNEKKLNQFLKRNNLELMIRSHEVCERGIEFPFKNCATVFSNTNYCEMRNEAALAIVLKGQKVQYPKFKPLSNAEKKKRRIIIPEWIFEEINKSPTMKEPQSPIEELSEPTNIPIV
ncbi:Serine/threonine-protein phosphatase PP1-2 [Tritrichomonas foetus]|uniref:Serine/threonine-protein phosphatase n=1 Tax=Tritrichomonas foetus TaxID=1144522 RepID=A0A1J4JEP9_9EUKA|nr:Serine/threonine-protein phosphatase PP1-2 [Tritrichomonas foetus]|eukprot:OHS95917.1 Serine/threonine-protein phosphatase PP1-2 [Tritrichomonas foetus]